ATGPELHAREIVFESCPPPKRKLTRACGASEFLFARRVWDLFVERNLHALNDVVLDPMWIPPLFRIDLHSIQLHAEVNVIATGHAGHTAETHDLAALHFVSFFHVNAAHVSVDCLQSVAMIDDDAVAVDA